MFELICKANHAPYKSKWAPKIGFGSSTLYVSAVLKIYLYTPTYQYTANKITLVCQG